jgi:hypothetical protein
VGGAQEHLATYFGKRPEDRNAYAQHRLYIVSVKSVKICKFSLDLFIYHAIGIYNEWSYRVHFPTILTTSQLKKDFLT